MMLMQKSLSAVLNLCHRKGSQNRLKMNPDCQSQMFPSHLLLFKQNWLHISRTHNTYRKKVFVLVTKLKRTMLTDVLGAGFNNPKKCNGLAKEQHKSEDKNRRVNVTGGGSAPSTHRFADSHPQVGLPAEALGDGPGDGHVGHGDHLDGDALLPLLTQRAGVFPGSRNRQHSLIRRDL